MGVPPFKATKSALMVALLAMQTLSVVVSSCAETTVVLRKQMLLASASSNQTSDGDDAMSLFL
jgi:hypothetical protein